MDTAKFNLDPSTEKKLLNFILNRSSNCIPIKRSEFSNIIPNTVNIGDCITAVNKHLLSVYGIEIQDAPRRGERRFICVTKLKPMLPNVINAKSKNLTLLFIVLSFIHMKGGEILEETLYDFLQDLDIYSLDTHPYFGKVKVLIEDTFVREMYLQRVKAKNAVTNEEQITYSIGFRAEQEITPEELEQFVNQLISSSGSNREEESNCIGE